MNHVEISILHLDEYEWLQNLEDFIKETLDLLEIDNWEVSVLLCDDAYIRELNHVYRGRDEATDVLSFALYADGDQNDFFGQESYGTITAGDIIISMEMLGTQAKTFNVSEEEELKRLVIHGILHLAGQDHETNEPEKEKMLQKQEQIMRRLAGVKIF